MMTTYQARCSKCETITSRDADDVFAFIAQERVNGWQIPDALENKPILCPTCQKPPLAA